MRLTPAILFVLFLTGCATTADKTAAANAHYTAQNNFISAVSAAQKPIFELEGVDGQAINLAGVKALRVYGSNAQQAQFQPAPVEPSPWIETLKIAKDLTLGVAPIYLGSKVLGTMNKMSDNIASGRGPVTTTTTTTSNANQANVSNANQANSANVTTSYANQANTATTTGNNSVVGSGSSSTPNTTTTTDSHAVSTATTSNSNHGTCTTGSC